MADEPAAAGATPSQQTDPQAATAGASAPVAPPGPAPADSPVTPGEAAGLQVPAPATPSAPATEANATLAAAIGTADTAMPDQAMIDELLKQAEFEDPSSAGGDATGGAHGDAGSSPTEPFEMPNFQQVMADAQVSSIDLLRDVELNVKIELGRSRMLVEDVLKLGEGSVVELDKLAGDPVDVFVNDRLVARGEVLVLNENFCVRVNEIVAGLKDEGI
jgi:flagellar motor switch protein FliN/FliY